jgi:3-oxoacyl-[acyl-carrier-protein] synthase II
MNTNGRRRVVISGMGAVTPNGRTMEETWANIRAGRSGIAHVEGFDMPEGTVNIAGQV